MNYKDTMLYKIVRPIGKLFIKLVYRPRIINKDYIPESGRVILAGNHTNNLDCILLLSTTKRQIHYLAKDELIKGWKKSIFINLGIIPVNRKIHDKSVIPAAKKYLDNELVIGIFPEGTTEKGCGYILPFKPGAVKLSYETDTKIVPFKIIGEYKPFKKGLTIIFDKPIKANKDIELSNKKLYNKINSMKVSD